MAASANDTAVRDAEQTRDWRHCLRCEPAVEAVTAAAHHRAHRNTVAHIELGHTVTERRDHAGDLVPGNDRQTREGGQPLLIPEHPDIGVAQARGLDVDPHLATSGSRDWNVNPDKRAVRPCEMPCLHFVASRSAGFTAETRSNDATAVLAAPQPEDVKVATSGPQTDERTSL